MEIINYCSNIQNTKSFPQLKVKKQMSKMTTGASISLAVPSVRKSSALAVESAVLSVKTKIRGAKRYAWLVLAAVLVALTPFAVVKIMSVIESKAPVVTFETTMDADSLLDTQMKTLALNNTAVTHDAEGNLLSSEGIPVTAVYEFKQPVTFSNYTVKSGDTVDGITRKFNLKNVSTLIAVNSISNVRSLRSGQKLRVPSIDGMFHTVARGETVNGLSVKYKVSVEDILDVNDLLSENLSAGTQLFIPGARMDSLSLRRAMGEIFTSPITASYRLTSRFGRRADPFTGVPSNHTGIDMACPMGTPVKAAMSGTVSYTGWSNIYGNYVILTHYDGYQTLYGHMSKIIAKKGQVVNQGDRIGLVGSTGYSTGAHLHFGVYKNNKLVDPLSLLK